MEGLADVAPDLRVGFVLSPGFTLLAFSGFIEALRHAADEGDRSRQLYCRWTIMGADARPVRASCGMEVKPWEPSRDPTEFDYVVIVGGVLSAFPQHNPATFAYLRHVAASGVPLVGACTGSFALAHAGLLDGRRCAVHRGHKQDLIAAYPKVIPVTGKAYVADGKYYTTPGGIAPLYLALALIETHCGQARALKSVAQMNGEPIKTALPVLPEQFNQPSVCGDWRIERAVELMRHRIREPYGIDCLAAALGTSVRQLTRAFQEHVGVSPSAFWRNLRLEHARWRLLNSSRTITEISHECGFSDASHFSRWFRKTYGETPASYRDRRSRIHSDAAFARVQRRGRVA